MGSNVYTYMLIHTILIEFLKNKYIFFKYLILWCVKYQNSRFFTHTYIVTTFFSRGLFNKIVITSYSFKPVVLKPVTHGEAVLLICLRDEALSSLL